MLAVEVFVSDGHVLVNELAPRPHNSGHWTLDAAPVSQFDQQVRAICGSALGPTGPTVPAAAMVNLLGDLWAGGEPNWAVALADPRRGSISTARREPRPGRKMGHLTVVGPTADDAAERALDLRDQLRAGPDGRGVPDAARPPGSGCILLRIPGRIAPRSPAGKKRAQMCGRSEVDADQLADGIRHGTGAEHDEHLTGHRARDRAGRPIAR